MSQENYRSIGQSRLHSKPRKIYLGLLWRQYTTLSLYLQLNTTCATWHITTSGCYSPTKGCAHGQDIGQL